MSVIDALLIIEAFVGSEVSKGFAECGCRNDYRDHNV